MRRLTQGALDPRNAQHAMPGVTTREGTIGPQEFWSILATILHGTVFKCWVSSVLGQLALYILERGIQNVSNRLR